ncbi:MAG: MFS transporter [Myxococcales bacterium]|nr:MFS transporter [Myxococcales bacterium]
MATAEAARQTRPKASDPLSLATLGWYALPGAGVSFLYTLILVMFLKFATDVLLVSSAAVGMLMLGSKVWDAVSDPVAGFLSDRTRTRRGRRKSWLLAGSLPLALFSIMLWAPPTSLGETALLVWIGVAIFGFYTAYTAIDVPHLALGAELSHAPRDRNRIFGARQLLRSAGLVLAFGIGVALLDTPSARSNAPPLAVLAGLATALSIWAAVRRLPPERGDYSGRGGTNPLRSLRDVWRNRLARIVLIVYFIEMLGMGGIGVLSPFVIEYVLEMPGHTWWLLLGYVVPGILSVPLWVRLGSHFEKRRLWMFAMGASGVGFGMLLFVTPGAWPLMLASTVIAGTAGACSNTIGVSLKADIIDVDEHATGERKEGAYFAAWAFVSKLAAGLMMGFVGVALQWIGFEPGGVQTPEVRRGILFLIGGLPLLGFGLGMALFTRFDLSEQEHARIRREIDARR